MKKQIFLITLLFTILVSLSAVNLSHIITLISDLQSRKT